MSQYHAFTDREESSRVPHRLKVLAAFVGTAVAVLLVAHSAGERRLRVSAPVTALAVKEDQCSGISVLGMCVTWTWIGGVLASACSFMYLRVSWYQSQNAKASLNRLRELKSRMDSCPDDQTVRTEAIDEWKSMQAHSCLTRALITNEPDAATVMQEIRERLDSSPQHTIFSKVLHLVCSNNKEFKTLEADAETCREMEERNLAADAFEEQGGHEHVTFATVKESNLKEWLGLKIKNLEREKVLNEESVEKAKGIAAEILKAENQTQMTKDFKIEPGKGGLKYMMYFCIASVKIGDNQRMLMVVYAFRYFKLKTQNNWLIEHMTNKYRAATNWMQFESYRELKAKIPHIVFLNAPQVNFADTGRPVSYEAESTVTIEEVHE